MSISFKPSEDLILQTRVPQIETLFTTFAIGHFVKAGTCTQPVKSAGAATLQETFAGQFSELYAAVPLELDFQEPNSVTDAAMEFVQPGTTLHTLELFVNQGVASSDSLPDQ